MLRDSSHRGSAVKTEWLDVCAVLVRRVADSVGVVERTIVERHNYVCCEYQLGFCC